MFFESNEFELMTENLIRKTKFDNKRIGVPDWISNWIKKTTHALEDKVYGTIEHTKRLKINQAYIKKVTLNDRIDYPFMLEFPKVTLSLTSIMSSRYHYDPQLMTVSSSMNKRFDSVSFKQKSGEKKRFNFINKNLSFSYLWAPLKSFYYGLKEDIQHLKDQTKNRSGIESCLTQKYTPRILNHTADLYLWS